jgi:DeoR family transcriptional regulator of aga operon
MNQLIPEQRRTFIYDLIQRRGSVSIQELTDLNGASISTVRRDLDELARRGVIERTHGGAILALAQRTTFEPEYKIACQMYTEEKAAIGRACVDLLQPGQSVIFDSSSTVYQAACSIIDRRCTILALTNDVNIAVAMANSSAIELKVLGGSLRPGSYTLLGEPGLNFLGRLHVDVCLLGIQAIGIHQGGQTGEAAICGTLSDTSLEVAAMKRTMIQAARKTVVLADSSKFGAPAFSDVSDFSAVDVLITDAGINPEQVSALEAAGVQIVVAS